jgi:hypothetical protein
MGTHPESLLARLQTIPDPRRRQGRIYPLPALLGMLLLGMLHGRDSLRGPGLGADSSGRRSGAPWAHATPIFPAIRRFAV